MVHSPMPKPSSVPLTLAPSPADAPPRPAKPSRRTFSAAEKLRLVQAADACTERGQIEALLRREGLYSSHLAAWRKALALRGREGLGEAKPGRKPTRDPKDARIAELEAKTARLERKLRVADELLALQKKVSQLVGVALPSDETP